MAEEIIAFSVMIPIVVGFVIGVLEAFFVYEDENMTSGKDFLGDMWHGLLFCMVGVFIANNMVFLMTQSFFPEFLKSWMYIDESTGISIVACVGVTLFMLIKMVASHAIKGVSGNGFSEKFWHKLVIALAVGFSPFYIAAFTPLIVEQLGESVPEWLPL